MKRQAWTLLTLTAAVAFGCSMATEAALRQVPVGQRAPMPPMQQNALIRAHCVGCHTSAKPAGGLALDSFDAARPDPGIARMLRVKIAVDGALGAAGIPQPDAATTDALVRALAAASEEVDAMGRWRADVVEEGRNGHSLVTVRIVQPAQRRDATHASAAYELTLSCGGKSRDHDATLARRVTDAANPPVPFGAAAPLTTPVSLVVDGRSVQPLSPDSVSADDALGRTLSALPARTLTVQPSAFPGEYVTFPFADLTPPVRQLLSWCFDGGELAR